MNNKNATHKVSFWGVRCYFNDNTGDLWGVNQFHERLIPLAIWFNEFMGFMTEMALPDTVEHGYRFKILDEF